MPSLAEIRSLFLNYFQGHDHKILPSSPLVPHNDPTLMFTNAGMNQFKNIFTGVEKAPHHRAVTAQKCVRAGGKHNDLDNVGYTARHHTFFEMLGNFSFGDYFKKDAIDFAWELLTKEFQLPAEKLLVTVYHDDDEAWNHWKKITGFADERIIRIATNDNFWAMGDTGPCGPCSEIFFDHGEHIPGGPPGSPDEDGDRFIEIWNLVFMQFDQQQDGTRNSLPKPSIDTGMGLERITAVLQGKHDNYDIDLFQNLIRASRDASGNSDPSSAVSHRVIADHLRASGFLIADGVMPSNEGRGYVLRRIMRRAMRHAHQLGCKDPLMHRLVPSLVNEMGEAYPELKRAEATIAETLRGEEERFKQTLDRGLKLLEEETSSLSAKDTLSGEIAFKLYDTYGFPLDLTQDLLRARNIGVNLDEFEKCMDEQRERARGAWSGSGEQSVGTLWFDLKEKHGATKFTGYEKHSGDSAIIAIIKDGAEVEKAAEGDEVFVLLEATPFYGESGGQTGDTGTFSKDGKTVARVYDTSKPLEGLHVHRVECKAALKTGDKILAEIDAGRRTRIRANHSATHLMHKALREVLGEHVTQKGSLVAPDRLRFDFSHGKAVTREEIAEIESRVNAVIWQNAEVKTEEMAPDDAIAAGAVALFGEKYGEKVRVLSMGCAEESDNAYSVELCGGTHVHATGDIGLFKIISEGAVAAGIRRIEAMTRDGAFAYLASQESTMRQLADSLKVSPATLPERIGKMQEETKQLGKELAEAKKQLALGGGGAGGSAEKEVVGKYEVVARVFDELPPKELRGIAEQMMQSSGAQIAIIGTAFEGKASLVVAVDKSVSKNISSVPLIQAGVETLGGKGGGGRPEMAQGGGPDTSKLEEALQVIRNQIASA